MVKWGEGVDLLQILPGGKPLVWPVGPLTSSLGPFVS
jgi:hypothetical protein